MKITNLELGIINFVLQVDKEGNPKQFGLSDLSLASDIFKEIKKCTEKKEVEGKEVETFKDSEIELTSEQKVFIMKLVDEREWTVNDANTIFSLKSLIK